MSQTQKLAKKMTIVLYGSQYWKEIINFDALVKYGMISPEDLNLFQFADDPAQRVRAAEGRADEVRAAARDAGDAGHFEVAQSAEAGGGLKPAMFSRKVAPGIEIRQFESKDAERVFAVVERNRAYLREWLPWVDFTTSPEDVRAFHLPGARAVRSEPGAAGAIWMDGEFAGSVGCHPIDWPNRHCSIGYWLGRAHQGKGIMTRCCASMLDYLFDELACIA